MFKFGAFIGHRSLKLYEFEVKAIENIHESKLRLGQWCNDSNSNEINISLK